MARIEGVECHDRMISAAPTRTPWQRALPAPDERSPPDMTDVAVPGPRYCRLLANQRYCTITVPRIFMSKWGM